jgi:hypothetical protein
VLALYYRIFVTLKFRIVVLTTAVFVILWLMTMEILLGLQCRPISRFWDPDVPGYRYLDIFPAFASHFQASDVS